MSWRGGAVVTERGGDRAKGEERCRAGPGAGRVWARVPEDPEAARRSLTRLGRSGVEAAREVPRAV